MVRLGWLGLAWLRYCLVPIKDPPRQGPVAPAWSICGARAGVGRVPGPGVGQELAASEGWSAVQGEKARCLIDSVRPEGA